MEERAFIQEHLPAEGITDENLRFFRAIGVDALCIYPPPPMPSATSGL